MGADKDDYKCITVVNPYCAKKDHTVYDKTCRTMVNFDCKAHGGNTYGGSSSGSGDSNYGGTSGGHGDSKYEPEYKCQKSHETKCYTVPRTVTTEYCEDREEKVCEKLTEKVPVPVERQNCHDENKKTCELEERSQPKQVKKYVYHKECRPVPETVCDNADQKVLQLSCVPSSRKECSYHPEERCENVPKQQCYHIPYLVQKMECSSFSSIGSSITGSVESASTGSFGSSSTGSFGSSSSGSYGSSSTDDGY